MNAAPISRANKALRIIGPGRVSGGILFFALLFNSTEAFGIVIPTGQRATLSWNQSPDSRVTGYNVYVGIASHGYINTINVGNVASTTISGLVAGVTYYFAVTAYDSLGRQSDYSNEATYTVPTSTLQIRRAPGGNLILTLNGLSAHVYEIQATQDLKNWIAIGLVTMVIGGSMDFTDANAQNFPRRFYRTRDILP